MLATVLVVVLILMLAGALPRWSHTAKAGVMDPVAVWDWSWWFSLYCCSWGGFKGGRMGFPVDLGGAHRAA